MEDLLKLLQLEGFLHTGYEGMYPLHPRARLVCGPRVSNQLMQALVMRGDLKYEPAASVGNVLGLTLVVDPDMEPDSWQLIAGEGTI